MTGGLEYLRPARDLHERGLYVELGAYRYQVFLDFREVRDAQGAPYAELDAALGGRGVPSLDDALADLVLRSVQQGFRAAYEPAAIRALAAAAAQAGAKPGEVKPGEVQPGEAGAGGGSLASAPGSEKASGLAEAFFRPLARLPGLAMDAGERAAAAAGLLARARGLESPEDWALLWAWVLLTGTPGQGRRLLEELRLEWVILPAWEALGLPAERAAGQMALLRLLLTLRPWLESPLDAAALRQSLASLEGRAALGLPPGDGPARLEPAAWKLLAAWSARLLALLDPQPRGAAERAAARAAGWVKAAQGCDYRFPDLLERLDA
jgi:hypothetical protein